MTAKKDIGLFALSGDPIHFGHIEVIRQAKEKVNKLLVLINDNDDKAGKYLFPLKHRVKLAQQALKEMKGVEVIQPTTTKVLADIYTRNGCSVLFRGIRNEADMKYEIHQMSLHNLIQKMDVEFISIGKDKNLDLVSSSLVKSFVHHNLDITPFVPTFIKRELEEKVKKIYKIAVTGQMATGKSYVARALCDAFIAKRGRTTWFNKIDHHNDPIAHVINLDELIREFYSSQEAGCVAAVKTIANLCKSFGSEELMDNETIDRAKLGKFLFSVSCPVEVKREVENIAKPFVNLLYRDKLNALPYCAEGTVVIMEWAQLAEMNMGGWTNHNVIVVESPDRKVFAERRGLTPNDLDERCRYQFPADEKEKTLRMAGKGQGSIIRFINRFEEKRDPKDILLVSGPITELHEKVRKLFKFGD